MKILETGPGDDISRTIKKAIAFAGDDAAQFAFNGVIVRVTSRSELPLVYRDWSRGMAGYLGKDPIVGPEYKHRLTSVELASDAKIEAVSEARREESRLRAEAADNAKKLAVQAALDGVGPLSVNDQSGWDEMVAKNSNDGYSKATVEYAIQWGRLMQSRIAAGAKLADIADKTSHLADTDGITGFMCGCAVNMLSQFWIHGEQLRRWHNKQHGHEGDGVVNPAVLSIG